MTVRFIPILTKLSTDPLPAGLPQGQVIYTEDTKVWSIYQEGSAGSVVNPIVDALADASIGGAKLATGIFKVAVVAGQDGSCDATYTLTGAAVGDEIAAVLHNTAGAFVALDPDDWSVTAANELTDGADCPGDYSCDELIVIWIDKT